MASRKCRPCTIPAPAFLTITVKGRSLIGITKHFVGFCYLLEFLLSIWLLIFVRVKLKSHFSVSLLHFLFPSTLFHPKNPVVVLTHCYSSGDLDEISTVYPSAAF